MPITKIINNGALLEIHDEDSRGLIVTELEKGAGIQLYKDSKYVYINYHTFAYPETINPDHVTDPINTGVDDLFNIIQGYLQVTGGGGFSIFATNYTDLNTNVAPQPVQEGVLAYVFNSEGTAWLPSTLGGTYYPRGIYVSTGTEWTSDRNAIAEQLQINIDDISQLESDLIQEINDRIAGDNNLQSQITAHISDLNNPHDTTLSNLIDTLITSPQRNDIVQYIGGSWVNRQRYFSNRIIKELADFENYNPSSVDIVLEDKVYFIDAEKLDITGHTLVFGRRTAIQGYNQNVSSFQSFENGGLLFKGTTNMFMNDIEVFCSAPNITVFDCQSDGTVVDGASFELNQMAFYAIDDLGNFQSGVKAGLIKDIRQGFMGTMFFFGFDDGFRLAGHWVNGGFRVENTLWREFDKNNTGGKIYYSDPLDPVLFDARVASNANIQVNGNSIGYDLPPTAFQFTGQYQLQNGNASGTGTYVTDWGGRSPAFDIKANFVGNTGIQNTFQGGEWVNSTDTVTTINTVNVWENLNVTTTNKFLTWFSELNGEFTYDGGNPLDVTIFLTLSATGKANDIVEVRLMKEDSLLVQTEILRRAITIQGSTAQGRAESVPIQSTDLLNEGDKVFVQIRNTSGTSNVTTLSNSNMIIGAK